MIKKFLFFLIIVISLVIFIGENLGGVLFFLELLKKEKKGKKIINCNTKQKLENIS